MGSKLGSCPVCGKATMNGQPCPKHRGFRKVLIRLGIL